MTTTLRRLDPDTFPVTMRATVKWHLLMLDADDFTRTTGAGLASVWHHVKRGEYDGAVRALVAAKEAAS